MVHLSVNINKIATLRNSRGGNNPDVLKAALDIESYGAHGITVHPRPDGRHIRRADVVAIKKHIKVELNIEGYPSPEFIELIREVQPTQVTLVPDAPNVLTSDRGWEIGKDKDLLQDAIKKLKPLASRISLFVDPYTTNSSDLELAKNLGADRVELYTKHYADEFAKGQGAQSIFVYQKCAEMAKAFGLGVNAGHDLNLENLNFFARHIPNLLEVSIGHALICDALYLGLKITVQKYLQTLKF